MQINPERDSEFRVTHTEVDRDERPFMQYCQKVSEKFQQLYASVSIAIKYGAEYPGDFIFNGVISEAGKSISQQLELPGNPSEQSLDIVTTNDGFGRMTDMHSQFFPSTTIVA